MIMRIIYLHGWNEKFDEDKYKILSKFGDEVYSPDINYHTSRNIISQFCNESYKQPVMIVGNSLGGYIGYHVSNICQIPAMLINPTFFFKNGGELRPNNNSTSNVYSQKKIIISSLDNDIDIKRTLKFLKESKIEDNLISLYNESISIDIFEKEFSEFREKYKFKIKKAEEEKGIKKGTKITLDNSLIFNI